MAPKAPIHSVQIARQSRAAALYNNCDDDDVSCVSQVTFDFSTSSSMVSDRTWDHPSSTLKGMLAGYGYGKYMPQQASEKRTAKPKRSSLLKKSKECEVFDFMTPCAKQPSKKSLYDDDDDEEDESGQEEQSKSISSRSRSLYSDDESTSDEGEEQSSKEQDSPSCCTPSHSSLEVALQQHRLRIRTLYNDEDEDRDNRDKADAGTAKTEEETDHSSCRATSPCTVESADPVVLGQEIPRHSISSRVSELSDIEEWSVEEDLSNTNQASQEILPVGRTRRTSLLRSHGELLAEQRKQDRAARLERAKERIRQEQELAEAQEQTNEKARKQAEEAKKAEPISQEERLRLAYQWYSRCGQPTRKQFLQRLPVHLGITLVDIELLPWTKDGERVDPKKGMALLIGRSS